MEELILKALDAGGVLALAFAILIAGGKKIDNLDIKLGKLLQITALGFSSDDKKEEVRKILES